MVPKARNSQNEIAYEKISCNWHQAKDGWVSEQMNEQVKLNK